MTYLELKNKLQTLNDEQLNQVVTVYDPYENQFISVTGTEFSNDYLILIMKA